MEKERDYLFDNLKVLLIFLVIFGHFSERYANNAKLMDIYRFIFVFHMPVFVFVSGYFSKNAEKCHKKAIQNLLMPYIFLNSLYYLYMFFIGNQKNINMFFPGWTLWYLLSLFFWRFSLKYIIKIKKPSLVIFISVVLGLLVGGVDKNATFLSFQRTFAFLPFYMLGYYANSDLINIIKKIPMAISTIAFFTTGCIACWILKHFNIRFVILSLSTSYKDMGMFFQQGLMFRIIFYICSILMCIFLISMIPRREYMISKIGKKTMIIYAGHIYFIYLIRAIVPVFKSNLANDVVTFASAIIILIILSTNIFEKIYINFYNIINQKNKLEINTID